MWHDFEEVQIANENKTTRMMFLNIFLIWTQWGRYSRSGCPDSGWRLRLQVQVSGK
jgi:hypothetical protein